MKYQSFELLWRWPGSWCIGHVNLVAFSIHVIAAASRVCVVRCLLFPLVWRVFHGRGCCLVRNSLVRWSKTL